MFSIINWCLLSYCDFDLYILNIGKTVSRINQVNGGSAVEWSRNTCVSVKKNFRGHLGTFINKYWWIFEKLSKLSSKKFFRDPPCTHINSGSETDLWNIIHKKKFKRWILEQIFEIMCKEMAMIKSFFANN